MNVFEYMNIDDSCRIVSCSDRICDRGTTACIINHCYKNGNLMVLAIQKMQEKGDWEKFREYARSWFIGTTTLFELWLFGNPSNFFRLMDEWLGGR